MRNLKFVLVLALIFSTPFLKSSTPSTTAERNPFVVDVTDKTFDATIKKGLVLVDFWATWCGPCRRQAPILEELATEMNGSLLVAKLDVDKNTETSGKYAVRSIPTLIIFKDGKAVERIVGLRDKDFLRNVLNKYK